ncbi:MAG: glycoside hydrolase family 140 protein [Saprospiraceae bacterium]|nr:glycoside hydrolase family 140 protein [Saprospiraceae bacterium]
MKPTLALFALLLLLAQANGQPWQRGYLKPSPDGHHLQHKDGTPFFWLADTGWELFHRLTLEDAAKYFDNRAKLGFNVIQAVAIAEFDGLRAPNAYGHIPFVDMDSDQPNEAYWRTVDTMIDMAAQRGLYVALLPTWGDKVTQLWGVGPQIFDVNEGDRAYRYGLWIGLRYGQRPNVLWMLGGDRPAVHNGEREGIKFSTDYRPVWRSMARGILENNPLAFITYHTSGGEFSTSQFIHQENWLKMNTMQSGHGSGHDVPVWEWIARDYHLQPTKPTLDAEPNYEDHPVSPWPKWDPANGYYSDYDVRKQTYRSVFAGGCGVTYGHHAVWQFHSPRHEAVNHADRYWTKALERPGAEQVGHLRQLIESRPMLQRVPDASLVAAGQGEKGEHIVACRAADGRYAMIYLPVGKTIVVNTLPLKASTLAAWWYDPRTGKAKKIGELPKKAEMGFTPPKTGPEQDWVLVLDDASAGYAPPGKTK